MMTQALAARLQDCAANSEWDDEDKAWNGIAAEALAFVREQMPTREEIIKLLNDANATYSKRPKATDLHFYGYWSHLADALLARLAGGRKG